MLFLTKKNLKFIGYGSLFVFGSICGSYFTKKYMRPQYNIILDDNNNYLITRHFRILSENNTVIKKIYMEESVVIKDNELKDFLNNGEKQIRYKNFF